MLKLRAPRGAGWRCCEAEVVASDGRTIDLLMKRGADVPVPGESLTIVGRAVDDLKVLNQEQLCSLTVGAVQAIRAQMRALEVRLNGIAIESSSSCVVQ